MRGKASQLYPALISLRPRQWLKNSLVLLPLLGELSSATLKQMSLGLVAAGALTCVCGALYLLNDINDVAEDRAHPRKRRRPIAAGELSTKTGSYLAVVLAAVGLLVGAKVGVATLLLLYAVNAAAYTLLTKRVAWLEMIAVAAGFPMRALIGGVAVGVSMNVWLLVLLGAGAALVVSGKRTSELQHGDATRRVLKNYSTTSLSIMRSSAHVVLVAATPLYWVEIAGPQVNAAAATALLTGVSSTVIAAGTLARLSSLGKIAEPEKLVTRDMGLAICSTFWLLSHLVAAL
jgi:decaprenyl-phosphate phosphoribosyltransferase